MFLQGGSHLFLGSASLGDDVGDQILVLAFFSRHQDNARLHQVQI